MIIAKHQLSVELAKALNITRSRSSEAITRLFQILIKHLKDGEDVVYKGFGTFRSESIKEAKRYNGLTKKEMIIPAHKRVRFKPCQDLQNF